MKTIKSSVKFFIFILTGLILLITSNIVGELQVYQGSYVLTYGVAIASIVLLTGYSGQLSLGHSALMAVGAYAAAIATNTYGVTPGLAIVIAVLASIIFGYLLGSVVARLSGPYLAGTTLALAVSLPTLANQFSFMGGEQGLMFDVGTPPSRFGESFSLYKWFFWICAVAALVTLYFISNILSSRYGRMFKAIRDNQLAAQLAGINTSQLKIMAFSISSGMAGMAGGLMVMLISGVSPSAFPLSLSFLLLTGAVVTGVYSLKGVMLGGLVLVAMPEIADIIALNVGGSDRLTATLPGFLVSALLILAVMFAPNGPGQLLNRSHLKKKLGKEINDQK
jgi:branched-chain amino acid transport system permease protein